MDYSSGSAAIGDRRKSDEQGDRAPSLTLHGNAIEAGVLRVDWSDSTVETLSRMSMGVSRKNCPVPSLRTFQIFLLTSYAFLGEGESETD